MDEPLRTSTRSCASQTRAEILKLQRASARRRSTSPTTRSRGDDDGRPDRRPARRDPLAAGSPEGSLTPPRRTVLVAGLSALAGVNHGCPVEPSRNRTAESRREGRATSSSRARAPGSRGWFARRRRAGSSSSGCVPSTALMNGAPAVRGPRPLSAGRRGRRVLGADSSSSTSHRRRGRARRPKARRGDRLQSGQDVRSRFRSGKPVPVSTARPRTRSPSRRLARRLSVAALVVRVRRGS
jgi:hypothetical protein